jgi:uncharacterized protein (TIGR00251 family)
MRVNVAVTANSKSPSVIKLDDGNYKVRVNAPAIEGRANESLVEILADHFGVPKSRIRIIRGLGSRKKVVEIEA